MSIFQSGAKRRHEIMVEAGLLDEGQPTEWAHEQHVARMHAEFTPDERRQIRYELLLSDVERAALEGKG